MISTISIIGADDSVSPSDLADISQKYPFVEWSINICSNVSPRPGFPSEAWLGELIEHADKMRLLACLHGRWNRDILDGNLSIRTEKQDLWNIFHRIQIQNPKDIENISEIIQIIPEKEFVVVTDSLNFISQKRLSPLLPRDKLFKYNNYCGYKIYDGEVEIVLQNPHDNIWLSVEGFRSENGSMDLLKIEHLLDFAEDYITRDNWMCGLLATEAIQKRISRPPSRE